MSSLAATVLFGCIATAAPAIPAGDQLPGTLNFGNETAMRVVQTLPEIADFNNKALDTGDFDNDGDLDVVVGVAYSDFGQRRNKLYRNDAGVFVEVSGPPIIPEFAMTDVTRSAFLRDFNEDGWLDIWIMNDGNSTGFPGLDHLYLGRHEGGRFTHFELVMNLDTSVSTNGEAFDANLDGHWDIFSANEPNNSQDRMYLGDGSGTFTNVTATHVPPDGDYSDDVASADVNGDGKPGLLHAHGNIGWVYYNDLSGFDSTGPGDYRYGEGGEAGMQSLGPGGHMSLDAVIALDFENDGDLDLYRINVVGLGDRVLRNEGLDAAGMVNWTELSAEALPPFVHNAWGAKLVAADFNADGREDVLVMHDTDRPAILRNASVPGDIRFLDWTPGNTFPTGNPNPFRGWHAAAFDTNGDGDIDILLGAHEHDHLFENVPANEVVEGDLIEGALPTLHNFDPVAVLGAASLGESDTYTVGGMSEFSTINIVLNGPDDYLLELLDGKTVLASSDRGGLGVEEVISQSPVSDTAQVRVTVLESSIAPPPECPADLNGTGEIDAADLALLLGAWNTSAGDLTGDGATNAADLALLLGAWGNCPGAAAEYILEVLSRG